MEQTEQSEKVDSIIDVAGFYPEGRKQKKLQSRLRLFCDLITHTQDLVSLTSSGKIKEISRLNSLRFVLRNFLQST